MSDQIKLKDALEGMEMVLEDTPKEHRPLVAKEVESLLHYMTDGDGFLELEEVSKVFQSVGKAIQTGDYSILTTKTGLRWEPVPIVQFIEDPFFLGLRGQVWPRLLTELDDIFNGPNEAIIREVVLGGSIGSGKCVEASNVVYDAATGRMQTIQNLVEREEGFCVPSLDADNRIVYKKATAFASGKKECLELCFSSGSVIRLSKDHPVRVRDGYVRADTLCVNDLVATARTYPEPLNPEVIDDDIVAMAAYLLADGGTTQYSPIFTKGSAPILEDVKSITKRLGGGVSLVEERKNCTCLRLTGLSPFAAKYVGRAKSKDKPLPDFCYNLDNRQTALFVNRFWSCDGYIRFNDGTNGKKVSRVFELCLASEDLIDGIRFLLKRLGIHAHKSYKASKCNGKVFDSWRLAVSGKENVQMFLERVGFLVGKEALCASMLKGCLDDPRSNSNVDVVPLSYPDLDFEGRAKFNTPPHQKYSLNAVKKIAAAVPNFKYSWLASTDLFWDRLVKITDRGVQEVYDLSVEDTHNFVMDHVVVHNSFRAQLILAYQLYKLSCYHTPQLEYGLSSGSSIFMIFQSMSLTLARKVLFDQFSQMLRRGEYFQKYFPYDKSITTELRFPSDVTIMPVASGDTSALGLNVFTACFPAGVQYLKSDWTLGTFGEGGSSRVLTYDRVSGELFPARNVSRDVLTSRSFVAALVLEDNSSIQCSPDQRFMSATGEWVKAWDCDGVLLKFMCAGKSMTIRCKSVYVFKYTVDMYDLDHVEGTHAFFVRAGNGFLVAHNCLDEVNFMANIENSSRAKFTGEAEYNQAQKLYSTITRRIKSRFNKRGKVPGKLCIMSSAHYPGDFVSTKKAEVDDYKARGVPCPIYFSSLSQWEAKPVGTFSDETFLVEVGDDTRRSRIIQSKEEAIELQDVIEVPVDFLPDFQSDIDAAIRDIAGVPVGGVNLFIKDRESIVRSTKAHHKAYSGKQLFAHDSVDLNSFENLEFLLDKTYISDYLDPLNEYAIHVDLALTNDCAGLAVTHLGGWKDVGKSYDYDEKTGKVCEASPGQKPLVVVDGALQIVPPMSDEIDINRIGDLIELLAARIPLVYVTSDTFQSATLLQRMRRLRNYRGFQIKSSIVSVDKNLAPWMEVKQGLRDDRLILPAHEVLLKELRELKYDPKKQKADHPQGGGKDVGDAVAGATYVIVTVNSGKQLKTKEVRTEVRRIRTGRPQIF